MLLMVAHVFILFWYLWLFIAPKKEVLNLKKASLLHCVQDPCLHVLTPVSKTNGKAFGPDTKENSGFIIIWHC